MLITAVPSWADTLPLNSTAAIYCPDCIAGDGPSKVINFYDQMYPGSGATISGPTPGYDYAANAAEWSTDFRSMATQPSQALDAGDLIDMGFVDTAGAEGAGLWAGLSSALGPVALGAGALAGGYLIGTGIRSLFVPATAPAAPAGVSNVRLVPIAKGGSFCSPACLEASPSNLSSVIKVSEGGWALTYDSQWSSQNVALPAYLDCSASGPSSIPSPLRRFDGYVEVCRSAHPAFAGFATAADLLTPHARVSVGGVPAGQTQIGSTVTPAGLPSRDAVGTGVANELNSMLSQPTSSPQYQRATELLTWYEHELNPQAPDPTATYVTAPDCSGMTYDPCAQSFQDAGFRQISRSFATLTDTDMTKAPGEVLSTTPAAGTVAAVDTAVDIHTNPLASDFPVFVPSIKGEETYGQYVTDLEAQGLTAHEVDLPDELFQDAPEQALLTDPPANTRVKPGTAVDVTVNPDDETNDRNRDCEPSAPGQAEPNDDPFAVHDTFSANDGQGGSRTTYMRWGTDTWGYTKVITKHGWGPEDITATAAALQLPPKIDGATYEYTGPEYQGKNGALCVRRVAVQTAWRPPNPPGQAKEIITSYGRWVGSR